MSVSKAIQAIADGDLSYRDRIRAYYRSNGKVQLTDKDLELLDRAETVQGILQAFRGDLRAAKNAIKDKLGLTHRAEIDRAIEDAVYLFGASITMNKSYQRLLQWQDIEWGLKQAKEAKDLKAVNEFMKRREVLFQLEESEQEQQFNYFEVIIIKMEYRPDLFKNQLPDDWRDRVNAIKQRAMEEIGITEDTIDAEYEIIE